MCVILENKNSCKGRVKVNTLLLQLESINTCGDNLKELAIKQNISKQALNWRLKQLIRKDFVRKVQSYPFAIYELTSLGERVKEILIHNEDGTYKPLWEVHNYAVGFDIFSMGKYQFIETKIRKLIQMNNWHYTQEDVGEFNIRITSTGKMIVYCPRRVTRSPDNEFVKMGSEAQRIAQDYCNRYDMKLSLMKQVRAGQKTLKKSEALAKALGKFQLGDIWTDNSDGTGEELEEAQDCNKIETLLDTPELMKKIVEQQALFSNNLMTHLTVLNKIGDGIDRFSERVEKLSNLMEVMIDEIKKRGN